MIIGILLIILGVVIISATVTYTIREIRKEKPKDRWMSIILQLLDITWDQLYWSSIFYIVGLGFIMIGTFIIGG